MPKSTKKTRTPHPRFKRILLAAVLASIVILSSVAVFLSIFASSARDAKTLVVSTGDSYQSVLNNWQTHPLASNFVTRLYLKSQDLPPLQKGTYHIPAQASLAQALRILEQGAEATMVKVQIIEGKTIKDLYQILKTTEGLDLQTLTPMDGDYTWADVATDNARVAQALGISEPTHLEGLFAPDTYFFATGASDTAVLKKLYERQQALMTKAWEARDMSLPYRDPYELLIMASIIEKETGITSERPQVSAVFVNRLQKGMRLQTDPTIIYGLFDRYDGTIYRTNIDEKTAYNTYQIDGLPPTPIALPSAEALMAAAQPDKSDYIFFVATGKGGHKFSKTLAEHNQAVAEYRRVLASQQ